MLVSCILSSKHGEILYKVLIKKDCESTFKDLADTVLIPEALKMPGCQQFLLFQNIGNSREFIFEEQWKDESDDHLYKEKLIELLGASTPGEEFPLVFNELIESDEDLI